MQSVSPEILEFIAPESLGFASFNSQQMQTLDDLNENIAACDSLESMIDFLFESIRPIVRCDRIGIAFSTENNKRIICRYARSDYAPLIMTEGYAEDLQGSTLAEIIQHGKLRVIHDLAAYLTRKPNSRSTKILLAEGVGSSITFPLSVDGRNVGIIFVSRREPNCFDSTATEFLSAVNNRLSQAIDKIYKIEKLAAANKNYMDMLGFVTHELKSPIAGIMMLSQAMRDEMYGQCTDKQRATLDKVSQKGEYLLSLIKDYLNLARMETGELEIHTKPNIDLITQVIEPILEMNQPAIATSKMRLNLELPPYCEVSCDPDLLKIALNNLVSNACKYGKLGGEIKIRMTKIDNRVNLTVWNEGAGFDETQRGKLFQKFSRLDKPEFNEISGTGVGLFTTWKIIDLHGGAISADSQPGKWAEFKMSLPID